MPDDLAVAGRDLRAAALLLPGQAEPNPHPPEGEFGLLAEVPVAVEHLARRRVPVAVPDVEVTLQQGDVLALHAGLEHTTHSRSPFLTLVRACSVGGLLTPRPRSVRR